jgi:hypothetical protein
MPITDEDSVNHNFDSVLNAIDSAVSLYSLLILRKKMTIEAMFLK